MEKKNQNIILGIILVILIASCVVTGLAIKNNSRGMINIDSMPNNNFEAGNSSDYENTTRGDRPTRRERNNDARPSGERPSNFKNGFNGRNTNETMDFDKDNFDFRNGNFGKGFSRGNKNLDLYLILFGLENVLTGAVIMYLIILNTRKETTRVKLLKK